MKIIITDTNVLLDIIDIEAILYFFNLPYEFYTTNFVIDEIKLSEQKAAIETYLNSGKLKVFHLSETEIDTVRIFKTVRNFKGLTDKTVLWKAIELKSPLLTGDGKLRSEAKEQGLEVRGSIWVIEEFVKHELIKNSKAISLLENLKECNSSLPFDEIDKLMKRFKE